MGCAIHTHVEQQVDGVWTRVEWGQADKYGEGNGPFDVRTYAVFGWLADVRNYSDVPPISEPRGLPGDASTEVIREYEELGFDAHSESWLSVAELDAFDYEAEVEDRRVTVQTGPISYDAGGTAAPGMGRVMTFRAFLGRGFFEDLARLREMNASQPTRVVFWFDN